MLLRHIRYFLAVAEHRNFTRAAEALHVSQPTLSQQIRQLEDTLGAALLDRSGRAIRLTDAGEAWLRYAKLALQDLDAGKRAIHDVRELSRGSLRIATTPTFTAYLVGPLLERFNARYPGITLTIDEMTQDRIEALLSEDSLDVGIAFAGPRSPDVESQTLFAETLTLVVGSAHRLAGVPLALRAQELGQEALVLLSADFATRRHIDTYCAAHRIKPRVAIEANSISAIIEVVRRSSLATVLPEAIAHAHHDLYPVMLREPLPPRTVVLLQRKDAYRSAAVHAFVELAASLAAEQAAEQAG
jgi:LysR family cyn operon transcriptional activator